MKSVNNKGYKFFSLLFIGLIVISIGTYRILLYTPPFLDIGKRNFVEKTIDFFCFGWHFTKASILNDYLKDFDEANRETGKAGWYRKKYLMKKYKVNEKNLLAVLDVYKNLKIDSILEKLYIFLMKSKNNNTRFLVEAGEVLMTSNNWKMANEALSKAIDLDPGNIQIHYHLGLTYLRLNRLIEAKEYLDKVTKLRPSFADAYYQLGIIAEREKNWEEAQNLYEKAVNILPNHLDSLESLQKINEKLE